LEHLTYEKYIRDLGLLRLENSRLIETKTTEPGSSQWYTVTEQEAMSRN